MHDFDEIWQDVKANRRRRDGCKRHRFDQQQQRRFGERATCINCGSQMRLTDVAQYIAGYEAAGGNADEIWPNWRGRS
ncbi:hypothetical protein [Aurantimonas coralicida]|uniref:hypothetical protein n=1 Tax=Aurantimonas coralicida TaxID=182270 RepID=UPI0023995439|nr:hypothetical protein [Aurantimonas coralicida]MDE0921493.1 hypothetical protein [Aurantimonas coralicida]